MSRDRLAVYWCLGACALAVIGATGVPAQGPPPPKLPTGEPVRVVSPYDRAEVSVNNSVVRQHKTGAWSVLGVSAINSRESDKEGLVAVFSPEQSARQFARRVWVPAESRRYAYLPFQVAPNLPADINRQSLTAIVLDPNPTTRETFQRREGDSLVSDVLIGISQDPVRSATYLRRPAGQADGLDSDIDSDAWAALMAVRKFATLPELANDFPTDFLPPWAEVLESFDQFLLTSDRIASDAAGMAALRSWVRDGGRLWLMLDRMSPDTARALLGNAINFSVVDRLELDQYTLDSLDTNGQPTVHEACEFETPVEFVRVVTSARDVPCRVNGWPAAMWLPFGEGEVLVTTLAPRGWRRGEDAPATGALRTVGLRLMAGRSGRVDTKQFQGPLQQRIGYRVPGRPFATTILAGYFLSLLIGGVVLYRRGQADGLIWLVPATTVVAAGILVGTGAANSRSIPPTVAFAQFVQVSPDSDELFVHGLAAAYDQQNRPVQWSGTERGWAIPEVTDGTEIRRQIWTSNDCSETQNASTRSGSVGLARLDEIRPLSSHFVVRAWFGPKGLEGQLSGDHAGLIDPVIVAPSSPSLAVELGADGRFASGPGNVLAANQFNVAPLLSDEQRRRQDMFRQFFNPTDAFVFPRSAALAAWHAPFDTGLHLPEEFHADGEALVLVPIELQRTPPGGEFRVPATFMRASSVSGGLGQSLAYNSKTGQWMQKLTNPSDTSLGFQLPEEVLPCELTKGTLTVRLSAPSRELKIWTFRGDERELLKTVPDPNGVYDFDLSAEHLSVDEAGRVQLGIAIGLTTAQRAPAEPTSSKGAPPPQFNTSTWQIEYARLTVDGRARQEDAQP